MIALSKIFQNAACFIGLHRFGKEQVENGSASPPNYGHETFRKKFRACAECGCERGSVTADVYGPRSCHIPVKMPYSLPRQSHKFVAN